VALVDFLCPNADIFAWSPSDMPGISREVAEHSLDILPHSRVVQQRLLRFDEERCRAIGVELWKLLEAGFIKEVFHPTWLANLVLVKKKNGKWRPDITEPSSLITNTPTGGSGVGEGRLSHWLHPGGGTSSSETSTTAT
jgi:hypothetical protein